VAHEGNTGIEPGKFVDIWIPATMFDAGALINPDFNWGYVIGKALNDRAKQTAFKRASD
jgi:hypothetical protein